MPKLKKLKCDGMNDHSFIFLARAVPALESLEVLNFIVRRFPEGSIFPNIRNFKAEKFRKDFRVPSVYGKCAALAMKECERCFPNDPVKFY